MLVAVIAFRQAKNLVASAKNLLSIEAKNIDIPYEDI